jgi:putative endonuclease
MSTSVANRPGTNKPKLLDQRVKLCLRARSDIRLVHYVYVSRSIKDGGFYIGYSANLRKRFEQHAKGVSLATSYRGPWKLIYYEAYLNQADALGRERYLKSGAGRRFLKAQLRNYFAEMTVNSTA